MKTVQHYLRQADRERLLDALAYDRICDTHLLLELDDKTIQEIQEAVKKHMDSLIENLLSMEVQPSDHMVLYMCKASLFDRNYNNDYESLCLIDLDEIRKDIYASSYAFEFTDWDEALGYLVADNKLTQDHMIDLLSQFLHEITFFGSDPVEREKELEEIVASLDRSMEEIEKGQTTPADEFIEELFLERGLPIDEKDPVLDELQRKIYEAEYKYSRYSNWRERSRILESLGEQAPEYEEEERRDV